MVCIETNVFYVLWQKKERKRRVNKSVVISFFWNLNGTSGTFVLMSPNDLNSTKEMVRTETSGKS